MKASKYCLIQEGLRWRNPDGLVLWCVDEDESRRLTTKLHAGFCGGHYAARTTVHKNLRAGYYWPTLFANVQQFVRSCQLDQLFAGR
jgi:hypothetical protein